MNAEGPTSPLPSLLLLRLSVVVSAIKSFELFIVALPAPGLLLLLLSKPLHLLTFLLVSVHFFFRNECAHRRHQRTAVREHQAQPVERYCLDHTHRPPPPPPAPAPGRGGPPPPSPAPGRAAAPPSKGRNGEIAARPSSAGSSPS